MILIIKILLKVKKTSCWLLTVPIINNPCILLEKGDSSSWENFRKIWSWPCRPLRTTSPVSVAFEAEGPPLSSSCWAAEGLEGLIFAPLGPSDPCAQPQICSWWFSAPATPSNPRPECPSSRASGHSSSLKALKSQLLFLHFPGRISGLSWLPQI